MKKNLTIILLFILITFKGNAQGFDTTYALGPANPVWGKGSIIKNVLADSNMILFSGYCRRDSVDLNDFKGSMPFIGASDYQGNLIWWKGLNFDSTKYFAGFSLYNNLLGKVNNNKYVISAMGNDGIVYPGNRLKMFPYLLLFNGLSDTLKIVDIPTYNDNLDFLPYTEIRALCVDNQKNILLTGRYCNTYEFYSSDTIGLYIAKFDSNGVFQWKKHYYSMFGNQIDISFMGLKILPANEGDGYIISSYKGSGDSLGDNIFHFVRIDSLGNILWEKNLPKANTLFGGGDNFERADFISTMNGSGYYFNSREYAVATETELTFMSYIGKIDNQGKVVWGKTIEFENMDVTPFDMVQLDNGNLVFNIRVSDPYTPIPNNISGSTTLLCTDSLGNVKWHKSYVRIPCSAGAIQEPFFVMSKSPYNTIAMGGYEGNQTSGPLPNCYTSWDVISKLALIDSMGRRNANDTDYLYFNPSITEVIYPTVGIKNKDNNLKKLVAIYPNPAQNDVFIGIKEKGNYNIVITDLSGRKQYEKNLKADITQINLETWMAGSYYIQFFESGQFVGNAILIKQ